MDIKFNSADLSAKDNNDMLKILYRYDFTVDSSELYEELNKLSENGKKKLGTNYIEYFVSILKGCKDMNEKQKFDFLVDIVMNHFKIGNALSGLVDSGHKVAVITNTILNDILGEILFYHDKSPLADFKDSKLKEIILEALKTSKTKSIFFKVTGGNEKKSPTCKKCIESFVIDLKLACIPSLSNLFSLERYHEILYTGFHSNENRTELLKKMDRDIAAKYIEQYLTTNDIKKIVKSLGALSKKKNKPGINEFTTNILQMMPQTQEIQEILFDYQMSGGKN